MRCLVTHVFTVNSVESYGKYDACENAKQHLLLDDHVIMSTYANTSITFQFLKKLAKHVSTV